MCLYYIAWLSPVISMTRGEVKNSDAYICAQAESPNTVTREVDAPGEALGGGRKRYVDSI